VEVEGRLEEQVEEEGLVGAEGEPTLGAEIYQK
jgi:hypothetical protein